MRAWQGFWRLSGRARGIALETAAMLAATWAGLRLVGFRRWKVLLVWMIPRPNSPMPSSRLAGIESAREIARIQAAVARHLSFHATCLEQSLVLWWLLARRGIATELRIGARKESGRFQAHAWVELGSMALNDSGETHMHFAPFDGTIISVETQIP